VLRGGKGGLADLVATLADDGGWSVESSPGVALEDLAAELPHGHIRRTTIGHVRDRGGTLAFTPVIPMQRFHCDLYGLTAEALDEILEEPIPNPVPKGARGPQRNAT
jgi:hypothetical protein